MKEKFFMKIYSRFFKLIYMIGGSQNLPDTKYDRKRVFLSYFIFIISNKKLT